MLGDDSAHAVAVGGPRVFGGDAVGAGVRAHRFPDHDPCGQHEDHFRAAGERAVWRCFLLLLVLLLMLSIRSNPLKP